MKKKLLFGIFLISIFLLSTVSMVQPVRGYKFGVPKEAVGMTGEGEIKIYDEDEWEKHFGKHGNKPDDVFDSGMDEAAAHSKSTVTEIETDEKLIAFIDDFLLEAETQKAVGANFGNPGWAPTAGEVATIMDNVLGSMVNRSWAKDWLLLRGVDPAYTMEMLTYALQLTYTVCYDPYGLIVPFVTNWDYWDIPLLTSLDGAMKSETRAGPEGIFNESEIVRYWGKKYDGTILYRDSWDYISPDENFDANPDEKDDEAPFLADPRDWYDPVDVLRAAKYDFYYKIDALRTVWDQWWTGLNGTIPINDIWAAPYYFHPYTYWNATLAGLAQSIPGMYETVIGMLGVPRNFTLGTTSGVVVPWVGIHDLPYGLYLTISGMLDALEYLYWAIFPEKVGLFWLYMTFGLPCYTPTEDYLAKVLDLFDIDEDWIDNAYYLTGYGVKIDVKLDGLDVVMDFEFYPEDPMDLTTYDITQNPIDKDPDDTLEDFTAIFRYSEYGTQSEVIFENDDGEVFFHSGGVEQIPGYEVTIILGASALSILALIYVFMKKRKM